MTTIDIAEMPVAEKLKLMETLWDSICLQSNQNEAIPTWHSDLLAERLRRLASGEEVTASWSEAKERIRALTKPH